MPRPDPTRLVWVLAALLIAAAGEPEPENKLEAVQQRIAEGQRQADALERQAAALAAEQAKLQDDLVAAAHAAQESEAQLSGLDGELTALKRDEAAKSDLLNQHHEHEAQVLAALQRVALNPPAAMLFSPGSPIDMARGGMLLGSAVPALEVEARATAAALADLAQVQEQVAAKRSEIAARSTGLAVDRQRIALLLRQKQSSEGRARADALTAQKHLAMLTAEAGDLKDLIQRLEHERELRAEDQRRHEVEAKQHAEREAAERAEADRRRAEQAARDKQPPPPVQVATAPPAPHDPLGPKRPSRHLEAGKPSLVVPVIGTIAKHFGDDDGFITSKGLSYATRPGAQVVAPFDGQVMFAGPFKGYGQILIIDHGGGYHSLLAGIDRIDGVVGQWVVAGEPVGTMRADESAPALYFEFRRQGQPINPLPWLVARDGKVSG